LTGKYDEMHEICVEPWFRYIPRVKWRILENSSHMAFWEERAHFMEMSGAFLAGY
jgi:L-proline amide hydrolase